MKLHCTLFTLTLGDWEVPLAEVEHVRASERLHFLEVSTSQGTRRVYATLGPAESTNELARLADFVNEAARRAKDLGDAEDVPADLSRLMER